MSRTTRVVSTRQAVRRRRAAASRPTRGRIAVPIAGFLGGWVDQIVMRTVDITLAFPPIFLAMAVNAAFGKGLKNACIAMTSDSQVIRRAKRHL